MRNYPRWCNIKHKPLCLGSHPIAALERLRSSSDHNIMSHASLQISDRSLVDIILHSLRFNLLNAETIFTQLAPVPSLTCALDPSIAITVGTPSRWNKKESASCWAFFSLAMKKAIVQPSIVQNTCAALLPCLDLTFENILAVKQGTDRWQYISRLSLILNLSERLGCILLCNPSLSGHKMQHQLRHHIMPACTLDILTSYIFT
jgi:hypothetical protein